MNMDAFKKRFTPKHDFFVCIDSDGCAFDSMEIKHKECFCPATIQAWGLQAVSRYARDVFEYVNLYSKSRGCNRFIAIVKVMDLLEKHKGVVHRGFVMPKTEALRNFVANASVLNNDAVKALTDDATMRRTMDWSLDVNRRIETMVHGIPPFPLVRESLEHLSRVADIAIVSATPREALEREWKENKLDSFISLLGAQEDGSKAEMIAAVKDHYKPENCLMLGDDPGDQAAAMKNDILFYPIRPGREEESWEEFYASALDAFLQGRYVGAPMQTQMAAFDKDLPDTPPWEQV